MKEKETERERERGGGKEKKKDNFAIQICATYRGLRGQERTEDSPPAVLARPRRAGGWVRGAIN